MITKKPKANFRAGQVSCALWENEIDVNGKPTTILKASVKRSYKGKSGNWNSSQSFSRNDIPLVIHVLNQAFAEMLEKVTEGEEEGAIE